MLGVLNNPSTSMPIMLSAIAIMNYYIRKYQMVRIKEYYEKMVREQEAKTELIAFKLLSDICLS